MKDYICNIGTKHISYAQQVCVCVRAQTQANLEIQGHTPVCRRLLLSCVVVMNVFSVSYIQMFDLFQVYLLLNRSLMIH